MSHISTSSDSSNSRRHHARLHHHPDACHTHHVTNWATGGHTNLDDLALPGWTHHRQVDLHRWTLTSRAPAAPGAPARSSSPRR